MMRLRTVLQFWSIALGLLLVLVGSGGVAAQGAKGKAPAKLDLNSATEAEIEAIKGVGPATAKKIVAGRPYEGTDVAQALEKAGVAKSLIPKISSSFTLGPATAGAATTGAAGGAATSGAGGTKTSTVPSGTTAPSSTASSSAAAGKSTTTAKAAPADDTPAKTPPQKGMVWVNTDSGVFHKEGSRWYGNTKQGKYMTEADAQKAGYKPSKSQ